jgi:hypothetical protein
VIAGRASGAERDETVRTRGQSGLGVRSDADRSVTGPLEHDGDVGSCGEAVPSASCPDTGTQPKVFTPVAVADSEGPYRSATVTREAQPV